MVFSLLLELDLLARTRMLVDVLDMIEAEMLGTVATGPGTAEESPIIAARHAAWPMGHVVGGM